MAIVKVNSAQNNVYDGNTATTIAISATSHTAGNCLAVAVRWADTSFTCTVADTAGNTFTPRTVNNANTESIQWFYAKNILGNATNIVTATFSSTVTYRGIVVIQFSGVDLTAPYDTEAAGSHGGDPSHAVTSGAFTTAQADEVLLVYANDNSATQTPTIGDGYTLEFNQGNVTAAAYKIVSATQVGVTATMTFGVSTSPQSIQVMTLKQASAAPAGPVSGNAMINWLQVRGY